MELYLSNKDFYKVYKASIITNDDLNTIINLYQPFIGNKAITLYFTLLNEVCFQEWISISTHEVLSKKTSLNLSDIVLARKRLEAIGLIKTYRKVDENDLASYIYILYAPKNPGEFFKDPLFVGLLTSSLGEKEVSRIKRTYTIKEPELKGYYDVSASYRSIFDNNKFALIPDGEKIFTYTSGTINDDFDEKVFVGLLKNKYGYNKDVITDSLIFEVKRLSTLFGIKEETMASMLNSTYIVKDKVFDIDELYDICRNSLIVPIKKDEESYKEYDNDSRFASKVNQMNKWAPYDYLKLLSNNSNPSPADVAIINTLSREYGLNTGVINAIIEYTLNVCDNNLPRAFCEKLASTLKRKNVLNAMEAINALMSKKGKKKVIKEVENVTSTNDDEEDDDFSLDDLKKMVEGL